MTKYLIYPVTTSLLFASSFAAAKLAVFELQPLTITLFRYVAALTFLSILIPRNKASSLVVPRNKIFAFILLGLFGIVGYHYFFFTALKYTAVANTAIINAMSPIATAVAARLVLHEQLSMKNYTGAVIAVLGVLFLVTKNTTEPVFGQHLNFGDMLMFVAVLSWVAYALLIKKLTETYSSFTLTFYAALFGVILLIPLSWQEGLLTQIQSLSLTAILSILYMGVLPPGLVIYCIIFGVI